MNIRLATVAIAAIGLASTPAMSEAISLKFTTAAPLKTPHVAHIQKIAKAVAENSKNTLKLEVFPASQLGHELDTIKQLVRGRLAMGTYSLNAATSIVPEFALLGSPYLWDSYKQVDCALDNHLGPVFESLLEKRGVKFLQWSELGYIVTFSKKENLTLENMQGRPYQMSQSKFAKAYWKSRQTKPVIVAFTDIPGALQTGMIEGGALNTIAYVTTGVNKFAPHMYKTRHIHQPGLIIMSSRVLNKLSPEHKRVINSSLGSHQSVRDSIRGVISFFEKKHLESGGTIKTFTAEERAVWKAGYTTAHQAALIEDIGGQAAQIWPKILAAKAACAA